LVAPKRPHGPRLLLPAEVELCNILGISENEYWVFVDQAAAYNGTRPKGYELIPDIRCEPVSSFIAAHIVQIGIALVSAAVSYALTPKPREQKQGGSQRTADAIGNSRLAPQSTFDSVQELANIGDMIPLVFSNRSTESDGITYGGVRVNSQLLWSQFVSLGKYQQLKVLCLFSLGKINTKPDYEGYAIGDCLLNAYNSYKVGLFCRDGSASGNNRIIVSDKDLSSKLVLKNIKNDDPFEVGIPDRQSPDSITTISSKAFSGARNPTTQTRFGAYSPFPNFQVCKLPYELCVATRGTEKEAGWDLSRKRKKVEYAHWPTRSGFISGTNGWVTEGVVLIYQILGTNTGEQYGLQRVYDNDDKNQNGFNYTPHGVDDVDSMTTAIRENTDSLFAVGELYLIGTAIARCSQISNTAPWNIDRTKNYHFEIVEEGYVSVPSTNLATHCINPRWENPAQWGGNTKDLLYSLSDSTPILYQQKISGTILDFPTGTRDLYHSWDIYTGQRIAMATVTNNRKCDVTEIGIKSKVYKRIRFANVDSQPNQDSLDRAYDDRTQITLGHIDRFITRLSFFMLQYREIGQTSWIDLRNTHGSNHTGLFAVKGNTPEYQYNYISISHPDNKKQYEYRFKPYPGNFISVGGQWGKTVNLLETPSGGEEQSKKHFESHGFNIIFSGEENYALNKDTERLSNPEWQIGPTTQTIVGGVKNATYENGYNWQSSQEFNGRPTNKYWKTIQEDIWTGSRAIVYQQNATNPWVPVGEYGWSLYWDGTDYQAKNGGNDPGPGVGNWEEVIFKIPGDPKRYIPAQKNGNHPENKYWYFYIKIQAEVTEDTPVHYDGTVSLIGGSGTAASLKVNLIVYRQSYKDSNNATQYYYYAEWHIDPDFKGSGFKNGDTVYLPSESDVTGVGLPNRIQLAIEVGERQIDIGERNLNPYDVIADWNMYEGDENSNRNEPEHEIVYVNEIVKPTGNSLTSAAKYSNLAYAGLIINSSKEWTNFSQFSAYFNEGITIEKLETGATGASNLFPEIAYALLTDFNFGAGKLVGSSSVNKDDMKDAAIFCRKNKFFWDGTISNQVNLRDFIFEHAGYCLLDFTIVGGKFSLKPAIPVENNQIDVQNPVSVLPLVKALFTDGNIKNLKVSFLTPEERQTFRAAVLYREETTNGFPEVKSVLVRSRSSSATDPIETFDLSGFCTSLQQAKYFAYFAINLRRLVDHGLTFQTAPQYIEGLAPGDYFRLVSEVTHTSRFRNGAVTPNGKIISRDDLTGTLNVYYWKPGTVGVQEGQLNTSNVSSVFFGTLFTVKNTTTENKIYKCESISYGEDGLIDVSGSYAPIETNTGQLSVMQNWDAAGFDVTGD